MIRYAAHNFSLGFWIRADDLGLWGESSSSDSYNNNSNNVQNDNEGVGDEMKMNSGVTQRCRSPKNDGGQLSSSDGSMRGLRNTKATLSGRETLTGTDMNLSFKEAELRSAVPGRCPDGLVMCLRINGQRGYNVSSLNVTVWDVARYKNTTHVISFRLQRAVELMGATVDESDSRDSSIVLIPPGHPPPLATSQNIRRTTSC